MYGLALEGEAGVATVVKTLLGDLTNTMGLAGYKNLADVQGIALDGKFMRKV